SLDAPGQASLAKGGHLPVLGGAGHEHEAPEVGIVGELLVSMAELGNGDRPPVLVYFKAVRIAFQLDGRHVGTRMGADPTVRPDVIDKQVVHVAMVLLVPPGVDAFAEQKSGPETRGIDHPGAPTSPAALAPFRIGGRRAQVKPG